jgi:hypothetical protein
MKLLYICLINTLEQFLEKFITPIIIAAITYFFINKLDEIRNRKKISRLGSAVLHTLIEEIENGRRIMKSKIDTPINISSELLPNKSWNGINTVSDEILLRILEVSKNEEIVGFPASEIRIHTKNYFEYIVGNWNRSVETSKDMHKISNMYILSSSKVLEMLKQTKFLLDKNSEKYFPK